MTDEAYVFNQTNRDRAIVRRSAAHKKCGSKSKKCKLGVDYMSKKEIEQQHGEVKSWNLNTFYAYEEFKQMPQDIQIEYINRILDEYKLGIKNISIILFHLSENGLRNYCDVKGILSKLHIHEASEGFRPKRVDIERFRVDVMKQMGPNVTAKTEEEEKWQVTKNEETVSIVKENPEFNTIETETMEFSTSYISTSVDYEALKNVEALFKGKRIRISISFEAV